jgi:hypothetical protein
MVREEVVRPAYCKDGSALYLGWWGATAVCAACLKPDEQAAATRESVCAGCGLPMRFHYQD